jgi:threonylcarbamoyladenosine tRNA methylthiotransferase MtaB
MSSTPPVSSDARKCEVVTAEDLLPWKASLTPRRSNLLTMPTAAFTTLGCKVNQYETQRILESFEAAGFSVVPFDAAADVYVINSCSVTGIAESKSRYTIRKATRSNPEAKVVVTGCAAQMALNKGEVIEGADVVVPNPEKLQTLNHLLATFPRLQPEQPGLARGQSGRTRATLKIQDGCHVMCSYCSIPFTRPGLHSRPYAEVLDEAEKMVGLGYKEIVLTGVLIGDYGPASGSGGPGFEDLVERLAQTPGLERLRISSIEMRQVTPRLIDLIRSGLVAPHLHIPLQSGDSQVLADMNRPYTQEDYLRLCDELYAQAPGISITTDIMVGFPTETEERFTSTLHVCERVRYLKIHAFRFSPRPGTPADAWGDLVPPQEKQQRVAQLAAVSARTGAEHARQFLGRTLRVLVEAKFTKDGLLEGLTDNYLTVRFTGPLSLQRQTCKVRLDEERDGVLFGELAA